MSVPIGINIAITCLFTKLHLESLSTASGLRHALLHVTLLPLLGPLAVGDCFWRYGALDWRRRRWHKTSRQGVRGFMALFTDSSMSVSCTRCLLFFSDPRTWAMTLCCSRTRSIIACLEPHLVGDSVMSWWGGRLSSACTAAVSLLFFQLNGKSTNNLFYKPQLHDQSVGPSNQFLYKKKQEMNKELHSHRILSRQVGSVIHHSVIKKKHFRFKLI